MPLSEAELGELRGRAQELVRSSDWTAVRELESRLREDTAYWVALWAPVESLAAWQLGEPDPRRFLDEAIRSGFSQPETLEGELERCFGTDPDWPAVVRAMAANVPPPRLELTEWPELVPAHPIQLATIDPDRAGALRDRLPPRAPSAWATATALLHWVTTRWDHSSVDHADRADAVHVLERVDAGDRFACKEFTIVLSQALNAVDIPARSVMLMRRDYHTGLGGGHEVTEAWIDDLRRWVVLDGQNGMYWVGEDGSPLGLIDLRTRLHAGQPPSGVVSLAGKSSARADAWWPYFHTVGLTGVVIGPTPYAPILENRIVIESGLVLQNPQGTHPDLLGLSVGIASLDGAVALVPVTRHPYALGFEVVVDGDRRHLAGLDGAWTLPTAPGEIRATVGTITPYGSHAPHPVRLVVR